MAHVLFMFLGAGRAPQSGAATNAPTSSYSRTSYEFPSGQRRPASLFGLALLDELAAAGDAADKVVVLGTDGSAWDNLVTETAGDVPGLGDLIARQGASAVTAGDLSGFAGPVQAAIADRSLTPTTVLEVIPYGFETAEQTALIELLARHVGQGDRMSFDVSNGFRHFPMLSVLAAIVVKRLRRAAIAGIWYGAFDHPRSRRDKVTPVVRLDGLAGIGDWLDVLAAFDADGNYGRFARLLKTDGAAPRDAEALRVAGFREHVGNLGGAVEKLAAFNGAVDPDRLSAGARLFWPALAARTAWAASADPYQHFRSLALESLAAEDLVRTARLAHEAVLTRMAIHYCPPGQILDRDARGQARIDFREAALRHSPAALQAFDELTQLRNVLVHGSYLVEQSECVRAALSDIAPCRRFLAERMATLLPEDPREPFQPSGGGSAKH